MFRTTRSFVRGTAFALVLAAAPISTATASQSTSRQAVPIEVRAANLNPGQYVWRPQRAATGAVEVVVSLPQQMAYVYRGGTLIGASTVSTGMEGHETPAGTFEILQKREEHYSNIYDNAPMPFMQRLTWDGIALHAGAIPGRPASHGCVRLPMAFARALYGVTSLGATVHIIEAAPSSPVDALEFARGMAPAREEIATVLASTAP